MKKVSPSAMTFRGTLPQETVPLEASKALEREVWRSVWVVSFCKARGGLTC